MTFREWIFSDPDANIPFNGAWQLGHILTLIACILIAIGISFLRKKDIKIRTWVIRGLIFGLLFFELTRRGIYIANGFVNHIKGWYSFHHILRNMLPRPWCAMSVWCLILSILIDKKYFYNFSAASALLNAVIFFAYPAAGFINVYVQFENLYSIGTHALLLITSISLITLKFTDFKYTEGSIKKSAIREVICFLVILVYSFIQMYIFKIEKDPMYFMKGNDVQKTLGLEYPTYLFLYIIFIIVYYNSFYIIQGISNKTIILNFRKPIKKYSRRLVRYKK